MNLESGLLVRFAKSLKTTTLKNNDKNNKYEQDI